MNESPGSSHSAVVCKRPLLPGRADVIKEVVINWRFHGNLLKVVFPSHSLSVSLSPLQVMLHTTSAPPRWFLHEDVIPVSQCGPSSWKQSNRYVATAVFFLISAFVVHPPRIDLWLKKILILSLKLIDTVISGICCMEKRIISSVCQLTPSPLLLIRLPPASTR